VARHDEREPIAGADRAGCTLRAWVSGKSRELGVRDDLAVGNASHRSDNVALELSPAVVVDVDVPELDSVALEVGAEPLDKTFQFRSGSVRDM
jgi:hypothetical protein